MIDIHNHIIPGVDDGPKIIEDSLQIARLSADDGVTVIFATPHVISLSDAKRMGDIQNKLSDLQSAVTDNNMDLRLVSGAEVYPSSDMVQWLDNGYQLTLGPDSRYILLDSPLAQIPMGLHNLIFELQTRRYIPVIAHPERVEPVQKNPQLMEELVNKGVLLQVNSSSILGKQGEDAEKTAKLLLKHRWVHFIASDAHSPRHRRPLMLAAAESLTDILDQTAIKELVEVNGYKVLNSEPVPTNPLPYVPEKKKSFFTQIFSVISRKNNL